MSKLNLSGVLGKRRKIRWITFLSAALLIFFAVQLILLDNPKKPKAGLDITDGSCVFTDATQAIGSNICDGKKLFLNNSTITFYGTRTFRLIELQSGSKITHYPLVASDIGSDGVSLTGLGPIKMVNLVVQSTEPNEGYVKLTGGSSIEANGIGYLGGAAGAGYANDGYGPGKSAGTNTDSGTQPPSKGAGFGGFGGGSGGAFGQTYPASFNPITFDKTSNFYFGSGSGGSYVKIADEKYVSGAAGGGRIHLQIQNSLIIKDAASYISANGSSGTAAHDGGTCSAGSGGGSGGMVWIEAADVQTTGTLYSVAGGTGSAGKNGDAGTADINDAFVANNITATGGNGAIGCDSPGYSYGGGGGRIVIQKAASASKMTIKKELFAVERNGKTDTNFNPYSLQKNDRITVKLTVSNINGNVQIVDDLLTVPNLPTSRCAFVPGSRSDGSSLGADGNTIVFDFSYSGAGTVTHDFSYDCKVQ